jgi:hypothetical protein
LGKSSAGGGAAVGAACEGVTSEAVRFNRPALMVRNSTAANSVNMPKMTSGRIPALLRATTGSWSVPGTL